MLKQAILYENEIKKKYVEAMCDDYFKFYNGCSYRNFGIEIDSNDWNTLQRVSVNSNGEVIGYICAEINRDSRNITGFGIMNFTKKPSIVFAKDLLQFLREIRDDYNANRFEFLAYVGSKADIMYKAFILKYGGRIVGTKKRSQKLSDGKYYDSTIFEILREDMKF